MKLLQYSLLILLLLTPSCNTPLNIFGTSVALVNNRNPDGTYKSPLSPGGAPVRASAALYRFEDDTYGISLFSDGTAPKVTLGK